MVSLAAVEALAGEFWPNNMSAVAAVKDPKKGEKLILLTDNPDAERAKFSQFLKLKGAQDLMLPAEIRHGEVPVLGSGKVDFVAVKKAIEGEADLAKAA